MLESFVFISCTNFTHHVASERQLSAIATIAALVDPVSVGLMNEHAVHDTSLIPTDIALSGPHLTAISSVQTIHQFPPPNYIHLTVHTVPGVWMPQLVSLARSGR
jgi:hypothetical protein